jgi:hypothetical protein
MNATKLAILAGLRSNFYMSVSQKLPKVWSSAKHNNTKHTTTNMRYRCPTPQRLCHLLPWQHPPLTQILPLLISLWSHTRHVALDALSLLFVPSFQAPKRNTSKITERDATSALGGHLLVGQHNNQPKVSVRGRRDIGEGTQSGRADAIPSFEAAN